MNPHRKNTRCRHFPYPWLTYYHQFLMKTVTCLLAACEGLSSFSPSIANTHLIYTIFAAVAVGVAMELLLRNVELSLMSVAQLEIFSVLLWLPSCHFCHAD